MRLSLEYVTGPMLSECPRCDTMRLGLWRGFLHDLRCWGVGTAFYNIWWRVRHVFAPVPDDVLEASDDES